MIKSSRMRILLSAFAATAALATSGIAAAQSQPEHQRGSPGMEGGGMMGQGGMMGGQGGMMGMMQGCPMMRGGAMGGGMGRGMPHLPPGNEKLEMQMHADMMRAMADIMTKYAARLPDKK